MSTALAEIIPDETPAAEENTLMEEVRIGFEQLRRMSHDELRSVISSRVAMLESVLREREERRAALDTARLAAKLLDLRRQRAVRINRRVNIGSALAAVASTVVLMMVMV